VHPGLAIFASGAPNYLYAVGLPQAPNEDVVWGHAPQLRPLEAMLDDNERIAVVLFDSGRARILSIFLGEIESEQYFESDVPGKQATGGWYSLAQTRMVRHREDHIRRHAERTTRETMDMLRRRSFDRLLLGGPPEALAILRRELPRPLLSRVAGQLDVELLAPDAQVLKAVHEAADSIELDADKHLVDELLTDGPHAVVGLAGTLAALADGRVHSLVLADSFRTPGSRCAVCDRLVTYEHDCPACGGEIMPVADLSEAIIARAHAQGARIHYVRGAAGRRLAEYGGVGAWSRF
jgi:peptide subunit release factor 1 (eRF1)